MTSRLRPRGRAARSGNEESFTPAKGTGLLITAVGASAGGMEAFSELVRNLPSDTGMAFVLVQHLDPKHQSILTELLGRETRMQVTEVMDGMRVEPNHVYVIPPNTTMTITDHVLCLSPRETSHGVHMPIDQFMRSLAEQQGNRAIGVILSGSGTDGTLGMAEIQAHGGVTFSQDETTAKYDSMPRSVIASGCVDYVLPPKAIARELARIARHPYVAARSIQRELTLAPSENAGLTTIFQLLRRSTGVDFTHYRQSTILRRIERRMVVHKIERMEDYVKYIQSNPAEIKALYQDMLINVTSFFRNPRVFEAIKKQVFPKIVKRHPPSATIRIWTPGCASGEETYSIAICLLEYLGDRAADHLIQLFGTDVSETNIARAREGLYPENIQGDVTPERLRRFFTKADGRYRINKNIRDLCIFAQHNVLNDPPFSQMNLICCRNLLIYLEPVLQTKLLSLFHYALRPGGYLVLGNAESVGTSANLFASEDRSLRIFSKKATAVRQPVTFSVDLQAERASYRPGRVPVRPGENNWTFLEAQKEFDRRLLSQFAPATLFVNGDLEVVHTRGNVSPYLKLPPGRASLNILKMAREGLLLDLRNAITRAKKENGPVTKPDVRIRTDDEGSGRPSAAETSVVVNLEVVPLTVGNLKEPYYMVVFHEGASKSGRAAKSAPVKTVRGTETSTRKITKLEQELGATKEYLESVIETQEVTNEELQSANEEILSSNEELQSTNEELETAKEELQSTNEELGTVNDELRSRNLEMTQINSDLSNLIASIGVSVVLVGSDLGIRRITPRAQEVLGLIPADVGRPLTNINPAIEIPGLQDSVLQVMTASKPLEKEVVDRRGMHYLLRVLPYELESGKVDGAVITLVAIPANTHVARAEISG